MIALTFDDGPTKYSHQLLDVLEKNGVRATFFVVGNLIDARRDVLQRQNAFSSRFLRLKRI